MDGENAHLHRTIEVNGVRLKVGGPIGGGCAITSRAVLEQVGGFGQYKRLVDRCSDAALMTKLGAAGLQGAYLEVPHAGGPYGSDVPAQKRQFWLDHHRRTRRPERIKRVLLRLPLVRGLNDRHAWFVAP